MKQTTSYTVTEELRCSEETGRYIAYGILAQCGEEVEHIRDITLDRAYAESLVRCFNTNGLSIIHFAEVVEDMIS